MCASMFLLSILSMDRCVHARMHKHNNLSRMSCRKLQRPRTSALVQRNRRETLSTELVRYLQLLSSNKLLGWLSRAFRKRTIVFSYYYILYLWSFFFVIYIFSKNHHFHALLSNFHSTALFPPFVFTFDKEMSVNRIIRMENRYVNLTTLIKLWNFYRDYSRPNVATVSFLGETRVYENTNRR